jgi:purine-binding chemotaxis protein CheW
MAIFSPLRSRRSSTRQTEVTQQLIAFRLRQEWFALPIETVLKVVPMGSVYGDPRGTGVSLTIYQGCELLVVDIGYRIFGEAPSPDLATGNALTPSKVTTALIGSEPQRAVVTQERYLLIVQTSDTEIFGLPIDSPPMMRRVPESSFTPLPTTYVAQGNIQCVSSLMIPATDQPPLFLLEPSQLVQRQ